MMDNRLNLGASSGSRASHRANSSVVSTKGFDPARFAFLTRTIGDHRAVGCSYARELEHIAWMLEVATPYQHDGLVEHTAIPREAVLQGEDWLQRTIDLAADMPWVREANRLASGMSASGQDPQGLEAKPASPTAKPGRPTDRIG